MNENLENIQESRRETLPKTVARITNDQSRVIEFEDNIETWLDKDKGLMWEVKTEENVNHQYLWSKDWVEKSFYPKELTDTITDAFSYVKNLNTEKYGGFKDWRIPTREELETISSKEKINNSYIKSPLSKNNVGHYWSSSTYENTKSLAEVIYFNFNEMSGRHKATNSRIRCVRGGREETS